MQREIDAVADELCRIPHHCVNITRSDEHLRRAGIVRKAARVDHGRQTDGCDRDAERIAAQTGAVIADAAAGRDAGVRELNGTAEPVKLCAGERVYGDDGVRVQAVCECA